MKLTCKEIDPTTDCHFESHADTASEVASKMLAHAKMEHQDSIKGKTDAELLKNFEAMAHE